MHVCEILARRILAHYKISLKFTHTQKLHTYKLITPIVFISGVHKFLRFRINDDLFVC